MRLFKHLKIALFPVAPLLILLAGLHYETIGYFVLFLGATCNLIAVYSNGKRMPSRLCSKDNGLHKPWDNPRFPKLCDWIGNDLFRASPGDFLIVLGVIVGTVEMFGK